MLTWPPSRPGPSAPAKLFTIDGASGTRLSTGGRAPDLTCSAKIGVSCIAGSGSAWAKDGPQRANAAAAVKNRRFISKTSLLRLCARRPYQFGPSRRITLDEIAESLDGQRQGRQSDVAQTLGKGRVGQRLVQLAVQTRRDRRRQGCRSHDRHPGLQVEVWEEGG